MKGCTGLKFPVEFALCKDRVCCLRFHLFEELREMASFSLNPHRGIVKLPCEYRHTQDLCISIINKSQKRQYLKSDTAFI